MKNKDKEKMNVVYWFLFGILIGVFILSVALAISGKAPLQVEEKIQGLEQQLQSCQEKIPVWTLNVYCQGFEESIEAGFTFIFDSYEKYQRALNMVIEKENCEVIK